MIVRDYLYRVVALWDAGEVRGQSDSGAKLIAQLPIQAVEAVVFSQPVRLVVNTTYRPETCGYVDPDRKVVCLGCLVLG